MKLTFYMLHTLILIVTCILTVVNNIDKSILHNYLFDFFMCNLQTGETGLEEWQEALIIAVGVLVALGICIASILVNK